MLIAQLDLGAIGARLAHDLYALVRLADVVAHAAAAWWVWRG